MENVKIHRIPLGSYQANCFLVENFETHNALIIDCGDGEELQQYIDDKFLDIKIKYGLITHGHFDHVGGVEYVQNNFGTTFFIGLEDLQAQYEEPYLFPGVKDVNIVYDGIEMNFEDFKVGVIWTPGHTKGGMTYKLGNHIFTGDTLFKGSIGRTDFYGGNFETLMDSIKNKLLVLPEDTIVHSGHGEDTTIGEEIRNNEFLK